jgi:hypothetical protein
LTKLCSFLVSISRRSWSAPVENETSNYSHPYCLEELPKYKYWTKVFLCTERKTMASTNISFNLPKMKSTSVNKRI